MTPARPLEWRQVSLTLGDFSLREVSIHLDPGEWIAIVGPTGAGKTLLLEVAAGFLSPDGGEVRRRGRSLAAIPPEERGVGYVPQDDLLFPHLDVRANLLFGVPRRDRARAGPDLARVTDALGIAHLLDRAIPGISGGEAQRIAIGRSLLAGADVLLLDECTSALDPETRRVIGDFLSRWRDEHQLSVVQVTHDPLEAERLTDRVVRLERGRVVGQVPVAAVAPVAPAAPAVPAVPGAPLPIPSSNPFPPRSDRCIPSRSWSW
jgi:ABC-type sulfate/molybdate transport systems ATPase subunit